MKKYWPILIKLRRCSAYFYEEKGSRCNKLFWPWQYVTTDYDPECSSLMHHECYHKEVESLFRNEDGLKWTEELRCEHAEKRVSS